MKYVQQWTSERNRRARTRAAGLEARRDDIGTVGLYRTQARERFCHDPRRQPSTNARPARFAGHSTRWNADSAASPDLRYDRYRADVDSSIAANSGTPHDRRASPKLSLVFGPWHDTELFLNGGRGFHSNDARGSTLRVDPNDPSQSAAVAATAGADDRLRNRPAQPSDAHAFAVGDSVAPEYRLRTGFRRRWRHDRTELSRQRHGIELSAYWQPSAHWLVDADYARSYARFSTANPAGTQAPNAIKRTASLGVQWSGTGRWSAAAARPSSGPGAAERRRQRAVALDDRVQRTRERSGVRCAHAVTRCLEPVRQRRQRHHVFLRLAAARRDAASRRHPLPSDRAAPVPPEPARHVLSADRANREILAKEKMRARASALGQPP